MDALLREEIGNAFVRVLEDAGVFKRDAEGIDAFHRFIRSIGGEFDA
jgi:UDPglucose--hexose-1-phosphate uridylyltransferase